MYPSMGYLVYPSMLHPGYTTLHHSVIIRYTLHEPGVKECYGLK